jgi:hypothetical protein
MRDEGIWWAVSVSLRALTSNGAMVIFDSDEGVNRPQLVVTSTP